MNEQRDIPDGLKLLRKPFETHQISRLPKPTKAQTDAVKEDYKAGIRCPGCGGWHHPKVVHLDYVGHAALTDRLLDCDLFWEWNPLAYDEQGLPKTDKEGGLWIKLTVCGVTRPGYGHAGDKKGGDATKEIIGDALRNAAMRFGAALDLWHKGDLHKDEPEDKEPAKKTAEPLKAASARVSVEIQNKVHNETLLYLENSDKDAMTGLWKGFDADQHAELWHMFNSAQRTAITKLIKGENK